MSNVTVLRSRFERTAWKSAFACALLGLMPGMNPDAADEASDLEFTRSHDGDPALAARLWVARFNGTLPDDAAAARA